MSEEEHHNPGSPEKYSPARQPHKRFLASLSLRHASYDDTTSSPYETTQPGFAPPPRVDDMPTLPGTRVFILTPRQVALIILGVVLALIVVFVAANAVGHVGTSKRVSLATAPLDQLGTPSTTQQTATEVGIVTSPGSTPSLGTPVNGIPTAASTPGSGLAATATSTSAPIIGHPSTPMATATPYPTVQPSPNDQWSNINVNNAPAVNGYRLSVVAQADISDCYKAPGQSYCGDYRSQVVIFIPNAASNHGAVHVTHYVSNCANTCPVVAAPIGTWDISASPYPSNQIDAFTNYNPLYFYKCAYADAVFSQNGQNIARATTSWLCLGS